MTTKPLQDSDTEIREILKPLKLFPLMSGGKSVDFDQAVIDLSNLIAKERRLAEEQIKSIILAELLKGKEEHLDYCSPDKSDKFVSTRHIEEVLKGKQ